MNDKLEKTLEILKEMPVWESLNITISNFENNIVFTRGNVVISMPYNEVVIFGAKTIFSLFSILDN